MTSRCSKNRKGSDLFTLLRYNSLAVTFLLLKCAIQGRLEYSQSRGVIAVAYPGTFSAPPASSTPVGDLLPSPSPGPRRLSIYFLSLWICCC